MTTMMTKKSRSACSISKSDPLLGDQLTAVFVAFGLLFFYFGGIGCFNPTLCFTSRPGANASASTFLCQQRSATSLCDAFGSLQAHLQLGENLVCSGPLRVADTACFCLLLLASAARLCQSSFISQRCSNKGTRRQQPHLSNLLGSYGAKMHIKAQWSGSMKVCFCSLLLVAYHPKTRIWFSLSFSGVLIGSFGVALVWIRSMTVWR